VDTQTASCLISVHIVIKKGTVTAEYGLANGRADVDNTLSILQRELEVIKRLILNRQLRSLHSSALVHRVLLLLLLLLLSSLPSLFRSHMPSAHWLLAAVLAQLRWEI
jgi:hypothetical protein